MNIVKNACDSVCPAWRGASCHREAGHELPHRCHLRREIRMDSGIATSGVWYTTSFGTLEWRDTLEPSS
jgi:hypothetical protein